MKQLRGKKQKCTFTYKTRIRYINTNRVMKVFSYFYYQILRCPCRHSGHTGLDYPASIWDVRKGVEMNSLNESSIPRPACHQSNTGLRRWSSDSNFSSISVKRIDLEQVEFVSDQLWCPIFVPLFLCWLGRYFCVQVSFPVVVHRWFWTNSCSLFEVSCLRQKAALHLSSSICSTTSSLA